MIRMIFLMRWIRPRQTGFNWPLISPLSSQSCRGFPQPSSNSDFTSENLADFSINPPLYCRGPGLNGLLKQLEDRAVERDFPTFIQTARQSKTPLPGLYSMSESVDLLLAGTDTLSITLVNILYHLSHNQSLIPRLQAEVDSLDAFTLPSLEKLPLLTSTIKEGLRMSHGVLGRLPRVAPSGGWNFEGSYVPTGTIISSSAPVVHNDPAIFPNPQFFVPDRWIKEDGSYNVAMEQNLMAFSKGQRSCIGIKYPPSAQTPFAWWLTRIVLHMQSCIYVWGCF